MRCSPRLLSFLSDPRLRRYFTAIVSRRERKRSEEKRPTLRHGTGYITHTWSQWRRFAAAVLLPGSRHASSGSPAAAAAARCAPASALFCTGDSWRARDVYAAPAGDDRKRNSTRWRPSTAASAATLTCHHREREERGPDNRTSLRVPPAPYSSHASLRCFRLSASLSPSRSPAAPHALHLLLSSVRLLLPFSRGESDEGRPLGLSRVSQMGQKSPRRRLREKPRVYYPTDGICVRK